MKARKVLSRVQGVSLPFVGVSWAPTRLDEDVARQIISFLEDRRALYNPYEVEMPDHVVLSIIEIRRFLTDEIGQGGIADELERSLRSMRGACREFLNEVGIDQPDDEGWVPGGRRLHGNGMTDFRFNQALGKLRGIFGLHVAAIAAKFELDVEDELAGILPPPAE